MQTLFLKEHTSRLSQRATTFDCFGLLLSRGRIKRILHDEWIFVRLSLRRIDPDNSRVVVDPFPATGTVIG